MKGQTVGPTFEADIRPLFRTVDREEMLWAFDLYSAEDVARNASTILARIREGAMPCDQGWPADWIGRFEAWMRLGMKP